MSSSLLRPRRLRGSAGWASGDVAAGAPGQGRRPGSDGSRQQQQQLPLPGQVKARSSPWSVGVSQAVSQCQHPCQRKLGSPSNPIWELPVPLVKSHLCHVVLGERFPYTGGQPGGQPRLTAVVGADW
ncbi:unnamed protein product [Lepidochelys olivacea]